MVEEDNKSYKCPFDGCELHYDNCISLAKHWTRTHKKPSKELYLAYYGFLEPTCACGCGSEVKYLDFGRGFSLYKWGHAASVKNNFQTEKSVANSKKTRKKMWKDGELQAWSKGLTKETDARLIARGEAVKKFYKDHPEITAVFSKRMSKNRRNGTIRTLKGSESPGWKGGVSSLSGVANASTKLYREWKKPIMGKASFKCEKCGDDKSALEVHHDKERMADIVRNIAIEFGWEQSLSKSTSPNQEDLYDLKRTIAEAVADYHIENKVSGICLCKECHKKIHKSHNF